jgi:hypothetical protein
MTKYFNVLVAKEFEGNKNGKPEKVTLWHKVGQVWQSRASENLNLELYLVPNQRFVIALGGRDEEIIHQETS